MACAGHYEILIFGDLNARTGSQTPSVHDSFRVSKDTKPPSARGKFLFHLLSGRGNLATVRFWPFSSRLEHLTQGVWAPRNGEFISVGVPEKGIDGVPGHLCKLSFMAAALDLQYIQTYSYVMILRTRRLNFYMTNIRQIWCPRRTKGGIEKIKFSNMLIEPRIEGYDHAALILRLQMDPQIRGPSATPSRKRKCETFTLPDELELDRLLIETITAGKDEPRKSAVLYGRVLSVTEPITVTIWCVQKFW
ncbi:hypothetical protein C8R44DRAFT_747209 [Mycena epipterygia]|nr:hypothetical protein C8R44DRAFT_747209 [Mycena epipterygia]